jgi:tripartite ATP-independent transporter DctM subunit
VDGLIKYASVLLEPVSAFFFRFSTVILGIMSIPIFCDVTLRYVYGKTIPGIIEIEEFMLVCIVFLSLAFMQKKKGHVAINILVSRFPEWAQPVVDCFVYLISTVIMVLVSYETIKNGLNKFGEVGFALEIPISIFVFVAAFGMILLSLALIQDMLKAVFQVIKSGKRSWLLVVLGLTVLLLGLPTIATRTGWEPSGLILGSLGMVFLFSLIFLKIPIAFAMALVGFLGMWTLTGNAMASLSMLGSIPYGEVANFVLCVAPLFILMGQLAYYSGMSDDLFDTAHKWLGRLPGGLSMSSVAGCAGFSAVCGDSLATAVTMGSVALPEMRKKNYSPSLATGGIAAGGTLGILIPPSVGFIFYALVTEESIGKLFVAGILPGILLTCLFIFCIYLIARLDPSKAPRGEKTTFKEKMIALKGVVAMLGLFVLILGGILGGIFSPIEGGAIGTVGAFSYALYRRRINLKVLKKATAEAANITCMLIVIIMGVGILGAFLASTRLPFQLADLVVGIAVNRYIVLTAIVLLYLLLGCVLNVIPIILLTMPAIFPTVLALNFDPIWFGVISVLLMEMGQITPPIGIIVFAVSSVAKDVPIETIFKGILPFLVCMIVCVIILTIFPQIATYLPNLLFK